MKRILLSLWLFIAPSLAWAQTPTGPPYQAFCNLSAPFTWTVSATASTVIAGVAGKNIFICGWHATTVTSNVQTSFQLFYASSTTAVSTALTPAFSVNYTAPSADHIDYSMLGPPNQATSGVSPWNVYINVGGNGQGNNLQFLLYYGQY